MSKKLKSFILSHLKAKDIIKIDEIQTLWSGYGSIIRYKLVDGEHSTIVVKHISMSKSENHPKGWNTDISHNRKLESYQVESCFYDKWTYNSDSFARIPICYGIYNDGDEIFILLEDLDASGFYIRKSVVSDMELKNCISWLANFHAIHMSANPVGLWKIGTYWNLETRPEELEVLNDVKLKKASAKIDAILRECKYQTILHGDAKLANFCFSKKGDVVAVDFQYVGGGVGVQDLAYLIGSCLSAEECEQKEGFILDLYFSELNLALKRYGKKVNFNQLESTWRELYPVAWTDFHRFLKGWSPEHWKINSYSERLKKEVLEKIYSN